MRRGAVLGGALLVFGCVGNPDPVPCNPVPECPAVDDDAADDDVRVLWSEGQKLVMTLDDVPADIEVVGGEVVFTPDPNDPDCEAECAITLKRLSMAFKTVYFVSSQDSVKVADLEVALHGPALLENPDGTGSVVPAGTEALTCATVQGLLWAHTSPLEENAVLVARATNEELTFDARVPLEVDGSTALGCRPFSLELSGSLAGRTPFDQNPTITTPP